MIKQGFHIGERDWWVMVYYDVCPKDLEEIETILFINGCSKDDISRTCDNLLYKNTGFTITNYEDHTTTIIISCTTSAEEMFDTIMHEIKHLVEHISNYYNINPKEEISAYLLGEVGRQMWTAAALVLCPKHYCN